MTEAVQLIARCGMNCGLCRAYLRTRDHCPGCRGEDKDKLRSSLSCGIKNCAMIEAGRSDFCFQCTQYPCLRIKHIDKRYRAKYRMSMIENLANIQKIGLDAFVENEKVRWRCQKCGGVICVHQGCCAQCGEKAT